MQCRTELTIVATGHHCSDENISMYLCEDNNGNPVLISEEGLAPVEEGLKWTDLKIGDIIKDKAIGTQYMITAMDTSENAEHHIFAGGWLQDSVLEMNWEKVEI